MKKADFQQKDFVPVTKARIRELNAYYCECIVKKNQWASKAEDVAQTIAKLETILKRHETVEKHPGT